MPSFTHSLNIIGRCTQMQRSAGLKKLGICGGQVPYLLRLCRCPGLTQEELAKALYFNKSTVTRQIAALEKQGLVRREPSREDRRCQLVYPTERALEIIPLVRELVHGWNDYLLADMTADERDQLQALMERVSQRARDFIDREVGWDGRNGSWAI